MQAIESMLEALHHAFWETLEISGLVFIALVAMDLAYVYSRGKMLSFLQKHPRAQYLISAFLGAVPGCEGAFLAVSLHTHGLITFGALLAAFIATTGDEAYVMFSEFPLAALGLTALLFLIGYLAGWLVDVAQKRRRGGHEFHCVTAIFHPAVKFSFRHYILDHVWKHIFKQHMIKIFLWTFATIFLIEWAITAYQLEQFLSDKPYLMLLAAGLVGLIPQSGPHLIFVTMFMEKTIPFSVLFTNMLVQNGHALLPLLSVSLKDSLVIKGIGLALGLLLGGALMWGGM